MATETGSHDSSLCFVISPIGADASDTRARSDAVLKEIIKPAAERNGLRVLRSDSDRRPGLITSQIIRHLLNARMVVADLTGQNANVFYELALRHAFRKPVIQIIQAGQAIPFDTHGLRTIEYAWPSDATSPEAINTLLSAFEKAREDVASQMAAALSPDFEVESTVTIAARLEELTRSATPDSHGIQIMETILEQIGALNKAIANIRGLVCRPDDLKDAIPPLIQNQVESLFRAYSEEIGLVKLTRQAGLRGIFKRRAFGLQSFASALDEETTAIMIVGSSLKGLLQREEYREIADKIRFKSRFAPVRFLLTHPIIADLRAKQEGRAPGEIGKEIIKSLQILGDWGIDCANVRLYLGTPTCFAIKTSRYMLLDPYPYVSTSYDSPCLMFERSSGFAPESQGYFYDEFSSRHFGAWETELSVPIHNLPQAIATFEQRLGDYSRDINELLARGKQIP